MLFSEVVELVGKANTIVPDTSDEVLYVVESKNNSYIEPTFNNPFKMLEQPQILLITASGASGKTTLANEISFRAKVPVWNLAKNPPVASNSFTGMLTTLFSESFSDVIKWLQEGNSSILLDGLDEARLKTSESGFYSFLDNLEFITKKSKSTSIVLLGRGNSIEDAWLYLEEKGVSVCLLEIEPFSVDSAIRYIDQKAFTQSVSSHRPEYERTRDLILKKLEKSFEPINRQHDFSKFLGYPPVLESIAVLLEKEKNYHKLYLELEEKSKDQEVQLLIRICEYILEREREEKVKEFIENTIASKITESKRKQVVENIYSIDDQCERILCFTKNMEYVNTFIEDEVVRTECEESIQSFFEEHPFLSNGKVRSPVFESFIISRCSYVEKSVVTNTTRQLTPNVFFVPMLESIADNRPIPIELTGYLLRCLSDASSVDTAVASQIESVSHHDYNYEESQQVELSLSFKSTSGEAKEFYYSSKIDGDTQLEFFDSLRDVNIVVPCDITTLGSEQFSFIGENYISCRVLNIESKELTLNSGFNRETPETIIEADMLLHSLQNIVTNSGKLSINLFKAETYGYPVHTYINIVNYSKLSDLVQGRLMRLRRILSEFCSHSKGQMAKFKDKIEHERVVKNDDGRAVLASLIQDKILYLDGPMYILNEDILAERLGISWQDIRNCEWNDRIKTYLNAI